MCALHGPQPQQELPRFSTTCWDPSSSSSLPPTTTSPTIITWQWLQRPQFRTIPRVLDLPLARRNRHHASGLCRHARCDSMETVVQTVCIPPCSCHHQYMTITTTIITTTTVAAAAAAAVVVIRTIPIILLLHPRLPRHHHYILYQHHHHHLLLHLRHRHHDLP